MEPMLNNKQELDFLLSHLKPNSVVLEWGSGGSTFEILKRVKYLMSIEHDEKWYNKLLSANFEHNNKLTGFRYLFVPRNREEAPGDDGTLEDYYNYIQKPKEFNIKFDVIFIDGRARVECARVATRLLKPGGIILIHDIMHPDPQYRRYEYDYVLDFLERVDGVFAMHSFKPKNITQQPKPVTMEMMDAKQMCWYQQNCVDEMNRAYEQNVKGKEPAVHLLVLAGLIDNARDLINKPLPTILDIGTGVGFVSELCKGYEFYGADLPHILAGCAMKYFPQYFYHSCDLFTDVLGWISQFDVILMNGFIDIMPQPIEALNKVLAHASNYVVLHRQEITLGGHTEAITNGSYGGSTYHSIIKSHDFYKLLAANNFTIVKEMQLDFTNWENNGNSFLLKKDQSWALHYIDHKLYSKYFLGKKRGVYIEVGANDGRTQSNTMYFEHYYGWTGILIEPIPEIYEKLKQNRGASNICIQAALVSDSFEFSSLEMIYTPECNGLLSVVNNGHAAELLKRVGDEEKIPVSVPAMTLNNILSQTWHPDNEIDLLVLDLEGYEAEALNGIILPDWKINFILVEQLDEDSIVPEIMYSNNYYLVEILGEHDFLYKRKF